jgi:hypothetical protein
VDDHFARNEDVYDANPKSGFPPLAIGPPLRAIRLAPTVHDQTADNRDNGIQGDHADQQEREHHERRPAFTVAVSARNDHFDNADEQDDREHHSARLGEPKPATAPPPRASQSRHGRSQGSDGYRMPVSIVKLTVLNAPTGTETLRGRTPNFAPLISTW